MTSTRVFSCKFINNTCFVEHLQTPASRELVEESDFRFYNKTKGQSGSWRFLLFFFNVMYNIIYSATKTFDESENWWQIFNGIFSVTIIKVFIQVFW